MPSEFAESSRKEMRSLDCHTAGTCTSSFMYRISASLRSATNRGSMTPMYFFGGIFGSRVLGNSALSDVWSDRNSLYLLATVHCRMPLCTATRKAVYRPLESSRVSASTTVTVTAGENPRPCDTGVPKSAGDAVRGGALACEPGDVDRIHSAGDSAFVALERGAGSPPTERLPDDRPEPMAPRDRPEDPGVLAPRWWRRSVEWRTPELPLEAPADAVARWPGAPFAGVRGPPSPPLVGLGGAMGFAAEVEKGLLCALDVCSLWLPLEVEAWPAGRAAVM